MASCRYIFVMQIAGKVNKMIGDLELKETGQLEQDLVFGNAGMKEVVKFFMTKEVIDGLDGRFLFRCHIIGEHFHAECTP